MSTVFRVLETQNFVDQEGTYPLDLCICSSCSIPFAGRDPFPFACGFGTEHSKRLRNPLPPRAPAPLTSSFQIHDLPATPGHGPRPHADPESFSRVLRAARNKDLSMLKNWEQ